jgi:hypothetical protein
MRAAERPALHPERDEARTAFGRDDQLRPAVAQGDQVADD